MAIKVFVIISTTPWRKERRHLNTKQLKANAGLKLSLQQVLGAVTAKCFEKDLIGKDDKNTANNLGYSKSVRSQGLVDAILDKIESHSKWYVVFMEILEGFAVLNDIVQDIKTSLIA